MEHIKAKNNKKSKNNPNENYSLAKGCDECKTNEDELDKKIPNEDKSTHDTSHLFETNQSDNSEDIWKLVEKY